MIRRIWRLRRVSTWPRRGWQSAFASLPGTSSITLKTSGEPALQLTGSWKSIHVKGLCNIEGDSTEQPQGFIDQVIEESASEKNVRDQLLNVLLAGRDTTAWCLSWTMYVFL